VLTLTRREGERIAIGDEVEITVVDIGRGKVRIGIRAPRQMAIVRSEVLSRIEAENQRATAELAPPLKHEPDQTIEIPSGLPGLRDHRSFVLAEVPGFPAMRALVSLVDPMVRLVIVEAALVDPGYPVADAMARAGLPDREVAVTLVVTLPRDGRTPTVNLLAPIVIGLESRRGEQVILDGSGLSARHELMYTSEPAAAEVVRESMAP
jgi:carbon storage regulator